MPNVGPMELLVVLLIALIVFGPKKLPEIGRGVGSALREFRRASRDLMSHFELDEHEPPRSYPAASAVYPEATTALSEADKLPEETAVTLPGHAPDGTVAALPDQPLDETASLQTDRAPGESDLVTTERLPEEIAPAPVDRSPDGTDTAPADRSPEEVTAARPADVTPSNTHPTA